MQKLKIVSFGEILYDVFPDGARLGGAPLNLAVHLCRQGAESAMISALGADDGGNRARAILKREQVGDEMVAQVPFPTGEVRVELDENKVPSYHFRADCAYDHIPCPGPEALAGTDLFCFGTLAQRGEESRATLRKLLPRVPCKVFCDVNLRQNFYSREILEESLNAADLLKLNDEELPVLAGLFGIAEDSEALAQRFQLECVILTLGPEGCEVYCRGERLRRPAKKAKIVSTVGAGDSFSAAFLYAYLSGKTPGECAEAGNRLAAHVAGIPGAF